MRLIDFRSDTVTCPTEEMRQAMASATVGDDVYGDDPTVNRLEELAASVMNKEAAMFVPSGTFGNLVAILTHCRRGDEVILGDDCHIIQHEAGGAANIAGVQMRTMDSEMGWLAIDGIKARIRKSDDIHYPTTGLLCLENAHSKGCVLPLDYMAEAAETAGCFDIPVHLDGARIFNAAEYLQVEPHQISDKFDSVMFCLSKGLCAPVGSILAGKAEFIEKARKNRKMLGGGMRQSGILAAAGIIALDKMTKRLGQDHKNARLLAKWLGQIEGITVYTKRLQINMVFCQIDFKPPLTPDQFIDRLKNSGILVNPPKNGEIRFTTHNETRETDIRRATEAIKEIMTKDFW